MRKKLLTILLLVALVFTLGACSDKEENHKLVYEEIEAVRVLHRSIRFPKFKIEGETEDYRMAKDSLKVTVFEEEKELRTTRAIKNIDRETNEETYRFTITGLEIGTDYELKIHASVNQEKVVIETFNFKTKLEGGSEEHPYLISTVEQFYDIYNGEQTTGFYELANDLDFEGQEIELQFLTGNYSRTFDGTFDGKGHKLANFRLPKSHGVFGRIGTARIKNLVIENASYSSFSDENKGESTRVFGILGNSVSRNGVVENITIKDSFLEVQAQSENNSKVGLIAGENFGIIKDIDIINSSVSARNLRNGGFSLGLIVGEARPASSSVAKNPLIQRISIDGNSSVTYYNRDAYDVQTSIGKEVNIGSVVGKARAEIKEVYSVGKVNLLEYQPTDLVYVLAEGDSTSITQGSQAGKRSGYFNKGEEVLVSIANIEGHELDQILVNGVDKKDDVENGTLKITPEENTHIIVKRKVIDETKELSLSGEGYEEVVPEGEEAPKTYNFGDTVKLKFKKPTKVIIEGVMVPLEEDLTYEFVIKKDTEISVAKNTGRDNDKTYSVGGIAGKALVIENVFFGGQIKVERLNRKYREFSQTKVSGIASRFDLSSISKVGVYAEIKALNESEVYPIELHSITTNYLETDIRDSSVVATEIQLNEEAYDDGLTRDSELNEEIFTSDFVKDKLHEK